MDPNLVMNSSQMTCFALCPGVILKGIVGILIVWPLVLGMVGKMSFRILLDCAVEVVRGNEIVCDKKRMIRKETRRVEDPR